MKKKMSMKKWIGLFGAVLLFFCIVGWMDMPVQASLERDFKYHKTDGGVCIEQYCGNETNVVIPERINGELVVTIGQYRVPVHDDYAEYYGAFESCKNVRNVVIPDGVTTIDDRAFYGCSRLRSITLPAGITYIGGDYDYTSRGAFRGCNLLQDIYYKGSEEQWANIKIADNLRGVNIHFNYTGDNAQGGNINNPSGGTGSQDPYGSQMGNQTPSTQDVPKSPDKANLSAASNTTGGIELTWAPVSNAEHYDIYRRNAGGAWTQIASVSAGVTEYTDTSVKSKNGTTYGYRIQAVNQNIKGEYSSEETVYRLTTPKLSSVKNNKSKKVTVKWKKAAKVGGYEVQYSTNANFKKATVKKVKSSSKKEYVLSELKKKKTYYIRIRTYMKVNKTTFCSAWSGAKQVKIRK